MPDYFSFYEFSGSDYEIGHALGRELAEGVRRQLADTLCVAVDGGMTREAALDWSLAQRPKVERLAPHWIDELNGIADGAGISFAEALTLQVRPGSGRMIGGCTSIAACDGTTVDGRPLGAQNRDLLAGFRERMVVTLLRPNGRTPLLMHSVPGELGGTGLNGHGLAIFANSIWAKSGRTWMGAPLLRRALLESADAQRAVELAQVLDGPAVGSFLLVDPAGHIRNLEIMPERVVVQSHDNGVFVHTNHCLDPLQQTVEKQPLESPGSPQRCQTMQRSLAALHGQLDVREFKRLLAQHEPAGEMICRHAQKSGEYETAAASIVETAARRLHLSYGPPCEGRWKTYTI